MPDAPKWNAPVKDRKKKALALLISGKSLWDGIVFLCRSTPRPALAHSYKQALDLTGSSQRQAVWEPECAAKNNVLATVFV